VKIRIPMALLAAAAIAASACGRHETPEAGEAAHVLARFAQAERVAQADRTGLTGTVAADQTAAVSSRVMATVTAVHVRLGDAVRAGQELVTIDPATTQGQVAQARGALAQAQAALTLAQRNFERFQALAKTQAASDLELDLARMQYEQAQGAVQQAQGAVDAAASVARESRVVAPFAGRVAQRLVEVGDLAAPGRPLVMIESQVGRRLVVSVPEGLATAAALKIGDAVPVSLDARSDLGEIRGIVAEVSPGPDPVSHAFTVKIDLAGVDVGAGAAGRVWLPVGQRQAVVVPREALVVSGGLTLVVVRDPEGRAQSRVVTLGADRADGRVEVLSGLAGDETLAVGLPSAPPAGTILEEARS
jgi:RND family efflux transporter MFP subunit